MRSQRSEELKMKRESNQSAAPANGHLNGAAVTDAGQTVLVLQGGGALGAYQVGVYQALHEAGIEPAWVIGTSIGAINGAIIAGNPPEKRLDKLTQFWDLMQARHKQGIGAWWPAMA